MKRAVSSLYTLLLLALFVVLFATGCTQQKMFDFSAPVAQIKPAPKGSLLDTVNTATIPSSIAQEAYLLESSTAKPIPATFSPRYATYNIPAIAKSTSESNKLEKRLLTIQKQAKRAPVMDSASSSLPLPTESIVALVFVGISLTALGVVIAPGFTLGTYLMAMLIGIVAHAFTLTFGLIGKRKGIKEPSKYNEKGARTVGFISLMLTALLAVILLALLIV